MSLTGRGEEAVKTHRERHDKLIRILLDFESRLEAEFATGTRETRASLLAELRSELEARQSPRTSKELDFVLQLGMMHITACLAMEHPADAGAYKTTISIFHPGHLAVLVKPCFYFPGSFSLQHPTIALSAEEGGTLGVNGRIGHTGLSLLRDEILHCSPPAGVSIQQHCPHYISPHSGDDQPSRAALCIPLSRKLNEAVQGFLARSGGQEEPAASSTCLFSSSPCSCR